MKLKINQAQEQELRRYLVQNLNMALDVNSETSYSNAFNVRIREDGFEWIPRMPSSIVINDALYEKIFEIASVALYPRYTLLKQNSSYIVEEDVEDIHVQRALFFPWVKGTPTRLFIKNPEIWNNNDEEIPIMKNLAIDYNDIISMALAGPSGSGKSYFLTYLLSVIKNFSDLVIIDPKMDSPARWAKAHKIPAIFPMATRSKSDFVNQVSDALSEALKLIQERQLKLYSGDKEDFKHYTVVIDETLSLTEGVPKKLKDTLFSLLSQIALMGRATKVHLILVSQRFDYNAIPVSVREQLNVLVQIGNINSKTVQFLFPDLDPSGIVIPTGKGTGLIQVIDSKHPYQVQPLLTPTYTSVED